MKGKLHIVIIVCCCFATFLSNAQRETFLSRSSIGPVIGGSYYIGDLNPYRHFYNTQLAFGLKYRFALNSRVALRIGGMYGEVGANDADAKDPNQQLRNLSFHSSIYEVAGGIEFNYLNYKFGDKKYMFSPYMFIDVGFFRMNPTTEYNDEWIELQPIGTEGQGSTLSDKEHYDLTQLVIPMGIGFKLNLGKRASIAFEYGIRKTFTDYLDDVGGDYINPLYLSEENGTLASRLSNRSLPGYDAIGPRGNSATNDWYSMFGIMLTFPLGREGNCHY